MGDITTFHTPANRRALVLPGAPADRTYLFKVRAYRRVDSDINATGIILSPEITASPYKPVTVPAFDGDITGTIQGRNSIDVVINLENIASDAVLSTTEKPALILSYNQGISDWTALDAKATEVGGFTTQQNAATAAKDALVTYLNGLTPAWNDTAVHTPIDAATFQNKWAAFYSNLADLAAAITGRQGDPGANGLNNATIFIYQRATSAPAKPSVSTTYTFSTGAITGLNNGWSATIPSGTAPLYVCVASASSSSATDTIASAEWTAPAVLSQDGVAGLNVATVFLYQRAASAPAKPSVSSTFTFSSGVLTGHNNGWVQSVPAGTDPLWVTTATAASASSTDSIPSTEWAAPNIMAEHGQQGDPGAAGLNNATVFIYQRATSAPAKPSVSTTYTFSTGAITGLNNGWSATIPAGTNPLYVSVASASSTNATDTIAATEWAAPTVLAQDGTSGLNVATVFLYKRSAATPAKPTVSTTYTFSTGVLTGQDNGWTQTVPTGTDPLWVITATAVSSSSTDSIPSTEWAAPNIMARDGATGANGLNNATIFIYQRATSAPAKPSVSTTYTFSTGAITGLNNGWTATIPSGTNPLYVSVAAASSSSTTDTIAATEWAAPVVLSQDGTAGLNVATVFLYKRAASNPAVPSTTSTFTFSTGVLTGHNNGWVQSVPTGANPLWVITASAASTSSTDSIPSSEWAAPNILAEHGSDGTDPPAIRLAASHLTQPYFENGTPKTQTISFTATRQNTSSATTWLMRDEAGASHSLQLTTSGDTATMTQTQFNNFLNSWGGNSLTVEARITHNGVNYSDTVSVTKVVDGPTGPGGPVISLRASTPNFNYIDGIPFDTSQVITVTADRQNTSENINWSVSPVVTLGAPDLVSRQLSITNFGTNEQVTITATGATSGATAQVILRRNSITTPADSIIPDSEWRAGVQTGSTPWRVRAGTIRTQTP